MLHSRTNEYIQKYNNFITESMSYDVPPDTIISDILESYYSNIIDNNQLNTQEKTFIDLIHESLSEVLENIITPSTFVHISPNVLSNPLHLKEVIVGLFIDVISAVASITLIFILQSPVKVLLILVYFLLSSQVIVYSPSVDNDI